MTGFLWLAWGVTFGLSIAIGSLHGGLPAVLPPLIVVIAFATQALAGRLRVARPFVASRHFAPRLVASAVERFEQVDPARAAGRARDVDAPAVVVAHGIVREANPALLDWLRWPVDGNLIVGMPLSNMVHPEDLARALALAVGRGREGPIEARVLRADDVVQHCTIGATSVATDAQAALLRFEPRVVAGAADRTVRDDPDGLLDALEQVLFQLDPAGRCTFLGVGWERLTSQPAEAQIGRPLSDALHADDRAGTQAALERLAAHPGETLLADVRLATPDAGAGQWFELRARLRTGGADRLALVGALTRIRGPKPLEKSVRAGRRRLNTLLANVPGMVYRGLNDRDWTMEFVSDGSIELTGYEPHEFIDKADRAFADLIHPEDREFVWTQVQTQLAQFKPFQLSYRIVDAAGETKWVWEQGRGIFSSSGELLALEGFITDVSARRGAEEQAKRRLWFDARTGLASRAIFEDRFAYVLEHTAFTGSPCALFLVDLDDVGSLRDSHGPDFVERVLVQLARRFKVVQGPGTTVSRTSGDVFAVLVTDFRLGGAPSATPAAKELTAAAARLAERIGQAIGEPLRIDGQVCRVGATIGYAIGPSGYASTDAMLQAAGRAVARARQAGPGQRRLAED